MLSVLESVLGCAISCEITLLCTVTLQLYVCDCEEHYVIALANSTLRYDIALAMFSPARKARWYPKELQPPLLPPLFPPHRFTLRKHLPLQPLRQERPQALASLT